MAHECPQCGLQCHCKGDIDDICFGERYDCDHCGYEDDFDEDEYYDEREKMNETNPFYNTNIGDSID
jgi:DNA-directed RNA polymerase subunit M/transcription elongation factor TFIIS